MERLCANPYRFRFRLLLFLAIAAASLLVSAPSSRSAGGPPTALPVVTDRLTLPLSNQFSPVNTLRLAGNGDVFFTSGVNSALFRLTAGGSKPARLLQTNDFFPAFDVPGEPDADVPERVLMDTVGGNLQVNAAGHAAMIIQAAFRGAYDPAGIFLLDEDGYHLVAGRGQEAPGEGWRNITGFGTLFLNDNDQVAFLAYFSDGTQGIVRWSPDGTLEKIAYVNDDAPGITGAQFRNLSLTGFNNAGQVAFYANLSGPSPSAVYIGSGGAPALVVKTGGTSPAGGTFNLGGGGPLSASGKVAFYSSVSGGPPGIFVGQAGSGPWKLVVNGDATPLGGTYSGNYSLRGFNNNDKALFTANIADVSGTPWALFLKDLTDPAQVVCKANQAAPGGTSELINSVAQASLNNYDQAALLLFLQGGTAPLGWYLGTGGSDPMKIALQGESTPLGGTFGLQGRTGPYQLNDAGQLAFAADVLGLNAVATFLWESGSPMKAVVSTNDTLPSGANRVIRSAQPPLVSNQEVVFRAYKAGGKATFFAKPLESGMDGIRRLWGEFDSAPGGGVISGSNSMGAVNNSGAYVFAGPVIGGPRYPGAGVFGKRPGQPLEAIALGGDSSPGGGVFTNFGPPQLNDVPQVAFWAGVASGPSSQGIFIATPGQPHQEVVLAGDPWPDGGTFGSFNSAITLNAAGQVGFMGTRPGSPNRTGLFVGTTTATPLKVAAQNDIIADVGTVSYVQTPWDMNADGQFAFVLQLSGHPDYGNTTGVFLGAGGATPQALALIGAPAPASDGGWFSNLRADNVDINDAGQVAFWAGINDSASDIWNGVYLSSDGGAPEPRLMKNDLLPDGSEAVQMGSTARSIALSELGELAIYVVAEKSDPEMEDQLPRFVIADAGGTLRRFAATAEKAEGTGSYFGRFYPQLSVNPAGRFFFSSVLVDGPAKFGLFSNRLGKQ